MKNTSTAPSFRYHHVGLLGAISTVLISSFFFFLLMRSKDHQAIVRFVCQSVENKFYSPPEEFKGWIKQCQKISQQTHWWESTITVLTRIQIQLLRLGVSHTSLYSPAESQRIWEGEGKENGLQVRVIADQIIVTRVFKDSPAARAGIRPGDVAEEVNNQRIYNEWSINYQKGVFIFKRNENYFQVNLEPTDMKVDALPQLTPLPENKGILEISSFRGVYFRDDTWLPLVQKINPLDQLIIDLRGNRGGSFVALLKSLSPFFCQPTKIGELLQPRKKHLPTQALKNQLQEENQYRLLQESGQVDLITYPNYGCYSKPVTVLIDSSTASVAEIFAAAFRQRKNSRIWGEPSGGDVLLAVWYFVPYLPPAHTLSIPEAIVLTKDNTNLEAQGVVPERFLQYRLNEALKGQDSWILDASQNF